MAKLKPEDLIPEGDSFKLRKTGKQYDLRALSVGDEMWAEEKFGENVINKIITNPVGNWKAIYAIVFRLLDETQKEDFIAKTVRFVNDEGDVLEKKIGGVELLSLQVSGVAEKKEIFQALLQTIGISRGMQDKAVKDYSEDDQKKTPSVQSQDHQYNSMNSSTSSPASMDGDYNTSAPSPTGNSHGSVKPSLNEKTTKQDSKQL